MESENHFDYIVIGGGSGGVGSGRWTAKFHGTKVAIIEYEKLGGTWVNVGCVPKKVTFNLASFLEDMHTAGSYGVSGLDDVKVDFSLFKKRRDAYIVKLNKIYEGMLESNNVTYMKGWAKFVDGRTVEVDGKDRYTADHILIAVGGKPGEPDYEGHEYTINSNGFFDIEEIPKKVIVQGGGYIAVELGQIFHTLGAQTIQVARSEILKFLDDDIRETLVENMKISGYDLRRGINIERIEKISDKNHTVYLTDGTVEENVEIILQAAGRIPNTDGLGCDKAGVELNEKGQVIVDEYENTSAPNIYAVGDVTGKIELTPVAIKAGRTLVERIFNKREDLKMDYTNVPTICFSHPPWGTVGLTYNQAKDKFGQENIKVYTSKFTNMYYSLIQDDSKKYKWLMKYITNELDNGKIVGLQVVGRNVDEMLQGAAIAIKMGATKKDFDSWVAIHPTGSEEFVLMDPMI